MAEGERDPTTPPWDPHRPVEPPDSESKAVCLLDLLGFESRFKPDLDKGDVAAVYAKYKELLDSVARHFEHLIVIPMGEVALLGVDIWRHSYFSDSILIWSSSYTPAMIGRFTQIVAELLCAGIEMQMPLRGAIAAGEAILDKESGVYLGAPLIEVARLEHEQAWIGCSVGPSILQPPYGQGFDAGSVIYPYFEHYKDNGHPLATGLVVDWPRIWRERGKGDLAAAIAAMDSGGKHSGYYQRTRDFAAFSEQNADWYTKLPKAPPDQAPPEPPPPTGQP